MNFYRAIPSSKFVDGNLVFGYESILMKSNIRRGDFCKLHYNGYAYGRLTMTSKIGYDENADIWIRWKSNIPDYEYIEPDNELMLTSDDITFEICEDVPENLILCFYAKTADEYDSNEWKKVIDNEEHYPKKRSKKKNDFQFEISEACEDPDTFFNFYFNKAINDSLKERVTSELVAFQQKWNSTHFFGIHDIMLMEDDGGKIMKKLKFI